MLMWHTSQQGRGGSLRLSSSWKTLLDELLPGELTSLPETCPWLQRRGRGRGGVERNGGGGGGGEEEEEEG